MPPVRALFLVEYIIAGGVERVLLTLLNGLNRDRVVPEVLVTGHIRDFGGEFPSDVRVVSLGRDLRKPWDLVRVFLGILREVRRADVVVAVKEGRVAAMGLWAAKLLRKPIIGWVHSDWQQFSVVTKYPPPRSLRWYGKMNQVVAVSDGARRALMGCVGAPELPCIVIHNGIDVKELEAMARKKIPDNWEVIFSIPTIVAVGRCTREKGFDVLLHAHALVLARGVKHNVVIVGDGPYLDNLKVLAEDLNARDSVHFLGTQPNPYPFMKRAALVAVPSLYEGLGMVIVEALLSGALVVAADCPSGPSEILAGGKYGVLVEAGNPSRLADALADAFMNPGYREGFARAFSKRAAYWDTARFSSEWESVLLQHSIGTQAHSQPKAG